MSSTDPKPGDKSGPTSPAPAGTWPQRYAASKRGMVATAQRHATDAGVEILEAGGNAVDAAVAAAFALGVCEPAASGLGGQTMMVVHLAADRRNLALDGSSRAPHRIVPGAHPRKTYLRGHRASTVPSTPAALSYALSRFGTLPLEHVLRPAIRLAEHGYSMTTLQRSLARREASRLKHGGGALFFLKEGGRAYRTGELFRQPVLASTLRRLSRAGIEDFYTGRIAADIHRDMVANDGLLREDDLAQIPWPIERRPLASRLGTWRVLAMPPPGAGRMLIEMLQILSHLKPAEYDPEVPEGAATLAEVIHCANLDRQDRPFDPHYYPQVEERRMRSIEYARRVARRVRRRAALEGETTHLSTMDAQGNAVALTQSIEGVFGSGAASPKLGFIYNNYMGAFEYEDISHPYYLRPNAAPWASVTPTIVLRGRRPWIALGSTGSDRIASAVTLALVRLAGGSTPLEAVSAPRLHCSLDRRVSLELSRFRDDVPAMLRRRGFTIDEREPFAFHFGAMQLVMRGRKHFVGVADPRRDGSARGP
jgi:gamma-glutamyltranspeptidase/glutathione hydrolase